MPLYICISLYTKPLTTYFVTISIDGKISEREIKENFCTPEGIQPIILWIPVRCSTQGATSQS